MISVNQSPDFAPMFTELKRELEREASATRAQLTQDTNAIDDKLASMTAADGGLEANMNASLQAAIDSVQQSVAEMDKSPVLVEAVELKSSGVKIQGNGRLSALSLVGLNLGSKWKFNIMEIDGETLPSYSAMIDIEMGSPVALSIRFKQSITISCDHNSSGRAHVEYY